MAAGPRRRPGVHRTLAAPGKRGAALSEDGGRGLARGRPLPWLRRSHWLKRRPRLYPPRRWRPCPRLTPSALNQYGASSTSPPVAAHGGAALNQHAGAPRGAGRARRTPPIGCRRGARRRAIGGAGGRRGALPGRRAKRPEGREGDSATGARGGGRGPGGAARGPPRSRGPMTGWEHRGGRGYDGVGG